MCSQTFDLQCHTGKCTLEGMDYVVDNLLANSSEKHSGKARKNAKSGLFTPALSLNPKGGGGGVKQILDGI